MRVLDINGTAFNRKELNGIGISLKAGLATNQVFFNNVARLRTPVSEGKVDERPYKVETRCLPEKNSDFHRSP